jgi:hypothetical protein
MSLSGTIFLKKNALYAEFCPTCAKFEVFLQIPSILCSQNDSVSWLHDGLVGVQPHLVIYSNFIAPNFHWIAIFAPCGAALQKEQEKPAANLQEPRGAGCL